MRFITERNYDKLRPTLANKRSTLYIDDSPLQNFQSVKILGVIVQSNLKWDLHVTEILKKCNRKLYMFRLLKQYGLSLADLKLVYTGYIRPVMEYCTPVFNGGLTQSIPMLAKYVNSQRLNPEG